METALETAPQPSLSWYCGKYHQRFVVVAPGLRVNKRARKSSCLSSCWVMRGGDLRDHPFISCWRWKRREKRLTSARKSRVQRRGDPPGAETPGSAGARTCTVQRGHNIDPPLLICDEGALSLSVSQTRSWSGVRGGGGLPASTCWIGAIWHLPEQNKRSLRFYFCFSSNKSICDFTSL